MRRFCAMSALLLAGWAAASATEPLLNIDFDDYVDTATGSTAPLKEFRVTDNSGSSQGASASWIWNKYSAGSRPYYYAKAYNWQKNSYDDWMTTLSTVHLLPGRAYVLSYDGWAEENYTNAKVAVGYGMGEDETAFTMTPEQSLAFINKYQAETPTNYRAVFEVEDEGDYYITFHANGTVGVAIDNILLVDGGTPLTPAAPTALEVTPGTDFATTATLHITLPAQTITGSTLTSIDTVVILRGGEEVARLTEDLPAPGETIIWTDPEAGEGNIEYSVYVICSDLVSEHISAGAYVGPMTPNAPTQPTVADKGEGGIQVSWTAPTKATNGMVLDGSLLKYDVYRVVGEEETLASSDLGANTYTDLFFPEMRTAISYKIVAKYGPRSADPVTTATIELGPLALPFHDSFAGASFGSVWSTEVIVGTKVWVARDQEYSSPKANPQDSDGGLATYNSFSAQRGNCARLMTAEFPSASATNTVLEYWFYNYGSSADLTYIEVQKDGGDWVKVTNSEVKLSDASNGWHQYTVALQSYITGSTKFRVAFRAESAYGYDMAVDNVSIFNAPLYDLQVASVTLPGSVMAGTEAEVSAQIKNMGASAVGALDYNVQLLFNGDVIESKAGVDIEAGLSADLTFIVPFNAFHVQPDAHEIAVKVVYDLDEVPANNMASANTIADFCTYPRVENVNVTMAEGMVNISWDAPFDVNGYTATNIQETFAGIVGEDGETDWNGWKVFDLDHKDVGTRYGFSSTIWAPFIVNNSYAPKPQTGNRCIGVMCPRDRSAANDWLVSPALNSFAATEFKVDFTALCMDSDGTRQYKIMYTENDFGETLDPEDFTEAATITITGSGTEWKNYSAMVPGVAKHIAIKNDCNNAGTTNLLLIDHVYIQSTLPQLSGYHVYHDGIRHNDEVVPTEAYTIDLNTRRIGVRASEAASHQIHVTAMYPEGESRLSDPVSYDIASGVNETLAGRFGIRFIPGGMEFGHAAMVFDLEGRLVAEAAEGSRVMLAPGVYVVRLNGKSLKALVK